MKVPNSKVINSEEYTFVMFLAGLLSDPKWGESYQLLEINNTIRSKFQHVAPGYIVNLDPTELKELRRITSLPTAKYNVQAGLAVLDYFRVIFKDDEPEVVAEVVAKEKPGS